MPHLVRVLAEALVRRRLGGRVAAAGPRPAHAPAAFAAQATGQLLRQRLPGGVVVRRDDDLGRRVQLACRNSLEVCLTEISTYKKTIMMRDP